MTTHQPPEISPNNPFISFPLSQEATCSPKTYRKAEYFFEKNLFRYMLGKTGVSCRKTLFLYAPGENYSLRSSVTYRRFSAHYLLPTAADFGKKNTALTADSHTFFWLPTIKVYQDRF